MTNRKATNTDLVEAGKVVVIGKPHITDAQGNMRAEYAVAAIEGIWAAGLPAEVTFRFPEAILRETAEEISAKYGSAKSDRPGRLGVGSIAAMSELEKALAFNVFNFVVSPSRGVGGEHKDNDAAYGNRQYHDPIDFVKVAQNEDISAAPATFDGNGVELYLFRDDGIRPDILKVFNSELLAQNEAKALAGLLAPYAREDGRHANAGFPIMPTGGVNAKSGPDFEKAIRSNGFTPILGMSDPITSMKGEAVNNVNAYEAAVLGFLKKYGK
tara:strand:+ start:1707 stop:2516 length:810 start_codon:yes stop_codon:yes gene_type:complete